MRLIKNTLRQSIATKGLLKELLKVLLTACAALLVASIGCNKTASKSQADPEVQPLSANKLVETEAASSSSAAETPASVADMVSMSSSSAEAVKLVEEGRSLEEGFRFGDATANYSNAVKLDPTFALAHAHLAALNRGEAAETHRDQALKHSTELPAAERLLIRAMVTTEKADRSKALDALAVAKPRDWRVQMMVARRAQKIGENSTALTAFSRAASLNPTVAYPHNNLAYLHAEEGNFDEAVASVTRYAELSPKEPNPLDSKGEILLMAGRLLEAQGAFEEALRLAPSFAMAHEGIAAAKFHQGDWQQGIANLKMAASKSERAIDRHEMLNKLAWAYVAADEDDNAKAAFAKVRGAAQSAGILPKAGEYLLLDAEIALKRREYKLAEKLTNRALAQMAQKNVPAEKQRWAHVINVIASARDGRISESKSNLAKLAGKDDHYSALASGHLALATGDHEKAASMFGQLKKNPWFRMKGKLLTAEALAAAGDQAGAAKIRSELGTTYRRDIYSIMISEEAKKAGNI